MHFPLRKKKTAPAPAFPRRNPLEAVPCIPVHIESGVDNLGLIQLRRPIQPKGFLTQRITRLTGFNCASRLNLDACGSFYWQQINGEKNLALISQAFAEKFQCPIEDARAAVLQFTRTLMLRNMVSLRLSQVALTS